MQYTFSATEQRGPTITDSGSSKPKKLQFRHVEPQQSDKHQGPPESPTVSPTESEESQTSSRSAPKKRHRLTLVCNNCKKRKIKCNKQLPCDSCTKSNIESSCTYDSVPGGLEESSGIVLPYISSARRPILLENNSTAVTKKKHKIRKTSSDKNDEVKILDVYKRELEVLKERIKHLESINNLQSFPATPSDSHEQTVISDNASVRYQAVASTPQLQVSRISNMEYTPPLGVSATPLSLPTYSPPFNQPVKLAPINWKSGIASPSSVSSSSDESSSPKKVSEEPPIGNSHFLTSILGVNPVFQHRAGINFYKFSNSNPFSWACLMKSDDNLSLLLRYISTQHAVLDEDIGYPKSREDDMKSSAIISYKKLIRSTVHKSKTGDQHDILSSISEVLPQRHIIWLLVYRYFEYLYPFIPFLDQRTFLDDVERLLGPDIEENWQTDTHWKLNTNSNEYDVAVIGTLLVVVRFSYLSLLKNNDDFNMKSLEEDPSLPALPKYKLLLRYPIGLDVMELARHCLRSLDVGKKTKIYTLEVVQFLYFMRFYLRYSPEDGSTSDEINYHEVSVNAALQLNLNIDPERVCPEANPRIKNLRRKMWYFLVIADIHNSLTFGNHLYIQDEIYDTENVYITEENSNLVNNVEKERYLFENIHQHSYKFHSRMKTMLKFILDSSISTPLSSIMDILNDFEIMVNEFFGGSSVMNLVDENYICVKCNKGGKVNVLNEDYILSSSNYQRIHAIKIFLSINNFLTTIYYYIYLYYWNISSNTAWFYLKKCLIYMNELVPKYYQLLNRSKSYCDFIINPTLQGYVHKSCQIYLSLIVKFSSDPVAVEFRSSLIKTYKILISLVGGLGKRYYYSWKIAKGHSYFMGVTATEEWMSWLSKNRGIQESLSQYQINELGKIVDYCLERTSEERLRWQKSLPMRTTEVSVECTPKAESSSVESDSTGQDSNSISSLTATTPGVIDIDQQWIDLISDLRNDPATKELTLFDLYKEL
ncbi:fungal-specific transcription factor [Scheffersomyces xylosifermentans]|uniref:fungal-specific transcription factor n=1 Tax=Scheffersomyces xylosifermentans TaxID=1304137 RepID=UPI00315CBD30